MSSFILVRATEAMAAEFTDMYFEAFGPNPANRAMYPDPNPAVRARVCEHDRQSLCLGDGADEYEFAVVDTSLPSTNPAAPQGAIVAHGFWRLEKEGVTWIEEKKEEEESDTEKESAIEGSNAEAKRAFFRFIDGMRDKNIGGRRLWHLLYLCVWPKHQGRGVASFFVKWGTQKADEMGLEAYLDSTPAGKSLYSKLGFEVVDEGIFDLEPWGGKGTYSSYAMLRQPKKRELNGGKGPILEE